MEDNVNHPAHYRQHPTGIECIDVVEHLTYNRGNAIKYLWRAGAKGDEVEDLCKAAWYVIREVKRVGADDRPGTAARIRALADSISTDEWLEQ